MTKTIGTPPPHARGALVGVLNRGERVGITPACAGSTATAAATMPAWCAGDEVYGRSGELRSFCEDNGIGYVLRVGRAFHTDLASGIRMRADTAAATLFST